MQSWRWLFYRPGMIYGDVGLQGVLEPVVTVAGSKSQGLCGVARRWCLMMRSVSGEFDCAHFQSLFEPTHGKPTNIALQATPGRKLWQGV